MSLSWRRHSLKILLAAVLVTGGGLRLSKWGYSLTGDEAYTVRQYASKSISFITSNYPNPNNHILFSVILHKIDEWSPKILFLTLADIKLLQLPSIAASLATLWLFYLLARGYYGFGR